MPESRATVEANARWLRKQREFFGWSTPEVARRAREIARELGDPIKLSQQLVSKFENRKMKSSPRWLGYAQLAFLKEREAQGLATGDAYELRMAPETAEYFESQRIRLDIDNPFDEFFEGDTLPRPPSDEDVLLSAWRLLRADQKKAIQSLIDSMIGNGTVQSPSRNYRGGG